MKALLNRIAKLEKKIKPAKGIVTTVIFEFVGPDGKVVESKTFTSESNIQSNENKLLADRHKGYRKSSKDTESSVCL